MNVRIGLTQYERIVYHADRLGWSIGELIRNAVYDKTVVLDDQEATERTQRNARSKTKAPKMGGLPGGVEATGITFTPFSKAAPTQTPEMKIPEKLTDSFNRFFREVEGAENARERSIKVQNVLLDLLERSPTEEIANFVFIKFQEQLKSRDSTKNVRLEKAPEDVPIEGGEDV